MVVLLVDVYTLIDLLGGQLSDCLFLVYTPHNEHFGIVPIEANYAGR